MKDKKMRNITTLMGIGTLMILFIIGFGYLFGSNTDWINQHTVFPDYFRKLFYETGNLFPQIGWNLGLGQNIYYFSYYGLLNPIILISYLFPFMDMTTYIMLSSSIIYLISIYLFYKWIEPKYNSKTSFFLTFLFICSGPILFHFHRHIMFVNYFPFLISSLILIDKDADNSLWLLTITSLLMILCSYYYSIGSFIVIIIYYLYKHFNDNIKIKIRIIFPLLIAGLLSGILTIPTLYTILTSRSSVGENISLMSLIMPNFNFHEVLYGAYALGLTSVVIPALINSIINKDKEHKFLGIILSTIIIFPIFLYLLNGGLYVRSKGLIPFIPLFLLIIGNYLNSIFKEKIDYKKIVIVIFILTILGLFNKNFNIYYYVDLFFTLVIMYYCLKNNKQKLLYVSLSILSIVLLISYHFTENFVTKNDYQELHKYDEIITEQLELDNDIYRFSNLIAPINNINRIYTSRYFTSSLYSSTYNNNYYNFYHSILNTNNNTYNHLMLINTNNIISDRLFGIKYILSKEPLEWGYHLLQSGEDWYLYENNLNLSIGYATSNVYSNKQFEKLTYPENLDMLLKGIVVENPQEEKEYISSVEKINVSSSILGDYISISNLGDYSILEVTKDSTININLEKEVIDKILLIKIDGLEGNSCDITDIGISIESITNTLSCKDYLYFNSNNSFHFIINRDNVNEFIMSIKPGTYKISNFLVYAMDKDVFYQKFDELHDIQINDNTLTGNINVQEDGYMVFSIPYDNGFEVKVDGNKISYEKVNNGFLGFPILKGDHDIEITYQSPLYKVGILTSLIGLIILIGHIFVVTYYKK